jgi:hypothetical protein
VGCPHLRGAAQSWRATGRDHLAKLCAATPTGPAFLDCQSNSGRRCPSVPAGVLLYGDSGWNNISDIDQKFSTDENVIRNRRTSASFFQTRLVNFAAMSAIARHVVRPPCARDSDWPPLNARAGDARRGGVACLASHVCVLAISATASFQESAGFSCSSRATCPRRSGETSRPAIWRRERSSNSPKCSFR